MNLGFDKDVFASKLRGKRGEVNISRSELAEKVGISSDAIVKYESSVAVPGADKVCLLAEALGCTPNYLMGWTDQQG